MNRQGPGPQPLRSMPGSMFQSQQSSAGRGAPLGAGRIQNGKLGGSSSSWGFNAPMSNAQGISNAQPRTNAALSSFAQTIGGSQSHTPLDLSEFPSLSGTPQSQQQNTSSQAIWSNPSLRMPQHTPVQRPQAQGTSSQAPSSQPLTQPTHQHQQQPDDGVSAHSQFGSGVDDYRFGGQSGVGQIPGLSHSSQPQTGNIDDFPPLGAGGGETPQDRRAGMIQNTFGGSASVSAFGMSLNQGRNSLVSPVEGQQDRPLAATIGDRHGPRGAAGVPLRSGQQIPETDRGMAQMTGRGQPLPESDRSMGQMTGPRTGRSMGSTPFSGQQQTQIPYRGGNFQEPQQPPIGTIGQPPQQLDQGFSSDLVDSPGSVQVPERQRLSQMSERERFGLPGFFAMLHVDSHDHTALAAGQDLTMLGLDLNRPDNSPLWTTFGSPFVEANSRPVIPDFHLPEAYRVTNVPPLHTKIQSFTEETLFAIFYQYPRDIMQEIAAQELYNRHWRWHTKLRQWMRKDSTYSQPPIKSPDGRQEHGWYIFFDVNNWRQERREYRLFYEDLDNRYTEPF